MKKIDYKGQRILVTGGTRGIGKKLVEDFSELGGDTFYTGTNNLVTDNYIQIDFINNQLDMFLHKIAQLDFDVCINNAGTNIIGPIESYSSKNWDKIIKLNLTVPFEITKALVPGMKKKKYGRIVNITSISSQIGMPLRSAYCSSKFGLAGLSRVSAVEMAQHGILINSVGPGITETELTVDILGKEKMDEIASRIPIKRLANVGDISSVVIYMASNLNSYIVGQNIIVDGGYTCI